MKPMKKVVVVNRPSRRVRWQIPLAEVSAKGLTKVFEATTDRDFIFTNITCGPVAEAYLMSLVVDGVEVVPAHFMEGEGPRVNDLPSTSASCHKGKKITATVKFEKKGKHYAAVMGWVVAEEGRRT
jgi:hypothetical protein